MCILIKILESNAIFYRDTLEHVMSKFATIHSIIDLRYKGILQNCIEPYFSSYALQIRHNIKKV